MADLGVVHVAAGLDLGAGLPGPETAVFGG
jgi:hypothetical protein